MDTVLRFLLAWLAGTVAGLAVAPLLGTVTGLIVAFFVPFLVLYALD